MKYDTFRHDVKSAKGNRYPTDGAKGYWNDWSVRDKEAVKEKTYTNCRFSVRVTENFWWGQNGTWYCHMTKKAAIAKDCKLDPPK